MGRMMVLAGVVGSLAGMGSAWGVTTASEVIRYDAGGYSGPLNQASSALGLPTLSNLYGAVTPFNGPFTAEEIVIVQPGGELTVRLSAPVAVGAGAEIGVFSNVGLIDVSPAEYGGPPDWETISGATGQAGSPPVLYTTPSAARVAVSADGQQWVAVSDSLISFNVPTNAYTDVLIDLGRAPVGETVADFAMPFDGTLDDMAGLAYPQMVALLAGSGGGTWLDVSGTGLSQVEYVRFYLEPTDTMQLMVDAVTAVPEPAGLGVLALGGMVLGARRRRT